MEILGISAASAEVTAPTVAAPAAATGLAALPPGMAVAVIVFVAVVAICAINHMTGWFW
jgi:hypothetical protein